MLNSRKKLNIKSSRHCFLASDSKDWVGLGKLPERSRTEKENSNMYSFLCFLLTNMELVEFLGIGNIRLTSWH
jgi:hypothetical protein